jgi:hypothetical protein
MERESMSCLYREGKEKKEKRKQKLVLLIRERQGKIKGF